jgi:hypothetical protein
MIFQVVYRTWTGARHATYAAARRELLSNCPDATPVSEGIPSEDGHGQLWLNPSAPRTAGTIMRRKQVVLLSAAEAWDHVRRGGAVVRLISSASRWYIGNRGLTVDRWSEAGGWYVYATERESYGAAASARKPVWPDAGVWMACE